MSEKPIQLIREEFATALLKLIDETPLPAFAKMDVLNGMHNDLAVVAQREYEGAKKYWAEHERKAKETEQDEARSNKQDKISEESDDISEDVDTI